MGLSYSSEISISIPDYISGTNRFQAINKLLTVNQHWKKEAWAKLKELFIIMREINASDMEIGGPGAKNNIWFRVFGEKKPHSAHGTYSEDDISCIVLSVLTDEQKVELFKNKNIDFSIGIPLMPGEKPSRFRSDVYYETGSLAGSFRRINQKLFPIENLELPEPILKRVNLEYEQSGLILVTGITGSGKSSTLDTIIDLNNHSNSGHIIIIGAPIEFIHESDKCIVRHRELGDDVLSFRDGAREALRQDPDILVVGEMRDASTMAMVLEITDSGHKVFSTLHTSSAVESIHRIVGEFSSEEQERVRMRLADTLSVIISQKLVPDVDGRLVLAKEILSVTSSVVAAIRNNNVAEIYQMISEGKKYGMFTIEQDLFNLCRIGKITRETAFNFANNKKRMMQLFHA
ncbi:MAG: ATPase, T2SS/T4P/T4SS family [Candidatus Cloacimonetes bacterium]|nr:ATPase, T2SS/T4P/T4SS family [Candidatus Cloacimonadota bacterium]